MRLPTTAGEPVGFTVLNLVRAVLDADRETAPAALAAALSE